MGITYLVITSVDRDDLPDGGAKHFAQVIQACRKAVPSMGFEILVPDFKGVQTRALDILDSVQPFVFSHNIETVPSLYVTARPGGDYRRSLELLRKAALRWPGTPIKSSMMLGLGEDDKEVKEVLKDLHDSGCSRVALGQYLQPDRLSLPVVNFVTPESFRQWEKTARTIGFSWVMASPLTRSSYHAEQQ
jgi:lipoic acid synthetase